MSTWPLSVNLIALPVNLSRICRTLKASISTTSGTPAAKAMSSTTGFSRTKGINAGNSDSGLRFYVPSQFSKNASVADFDRTHSFTGAANYELPFGKGKKWAATGPAMHILGGWQVNPTFQIYSGLPFIVTADGSTLNAPGNTQVADLSGTAKQLGGVGLGNPFYDPSAFKAVSETRFGNMGLNELRGPRYFLMNMGIFRQFAVSDRFGLQFRCEALNLTNTPTLNNPNVNVSTPANFMAITGAGTGLAPRPRRRRRSHPAPERDLAPSSPISGR